MFKKAVNIFFVFLMIVPLVNAEGIQEVYANKDAEVKATFAGGNGSRSSPYLISNSSHLNNVRYYRNKHFKLIDEVDMSNYSNWDPINDFYGSLDGNGYAIKNLKINRSNEDYVGLFEEIRDYYDSGFNGVKNLRLENVDVRGRNYVGALAGRMYSNSSSTSYRVEVNNVYTDGKVQGRNHRIGGLIGSVNSYGNIYYATSDADVYAYGCNYCTTDYIGGLVGNFEYGNITDSVVSGNVNAQAPYYGYHVYKVGGLVGRTYSYSSSNRYVKLYRNATKGNVYTRTNSGSRYTQYVGGLVGYSDGRRTYIYDNYTEGETRLHPSSYYRGRYGGGVIGYLNNYYSVRTGSWCHTHTRYVSGWYHTHYVSGWWHSGYWSWSYYSGWYYTPGHWHSGYSWSHWHSGYYTSYCHRHYSYSNYYGGYIYRNISKGKFMTYYRYNDYNGGFAGYLRGARAYDNYAANSDVYNQYSASYVQNFTDYLHGYRSRNYYRYGLRGSSSYTNGYRTDAQLKRQGTYNYYNFSSYWYIDEYDDYPILRRLRTGPQLTSPSNNYDLVGTSIYLRWKNDTVKANNRYYIHIQKKEPGKSWTNVGTWSTTSTQYRFNIPSGTIGNTDFRWRVSGRNYSNVTGLYTGFREFTFVNNPTQFWLYASNGSLSLEPNDRDHWIRTRVKDPDSFNYVRLYTRSYLGGSYYGNRTVDTWTGTTDDTNRYKLLMRPNFSRQYYHLYLYDEAGRYKATYFTWHRMQSMSDRSARNYKIQFYAADYQRSNWSWLSTTPVRSFYLSIDTRNQRPVITTVSTDIAGREFSDNQGYNKISFSGRVYDDDPYWSSDVYYTVQKYRSDGKYSMNPSNDVKVGTYRAGYWGVSSSFSGTYVVDYKLNNGKYAMVFYARDHRDGTLSTKKIDYFNVNRTAPDIDFYATYNGNTFSTAERQVVAKDTRLKLYFNAKRYQNFEYAGYQVRGSTITDLTTRGAFTNDIPSSYVGLDLSDSKFKEGDILVFKFKAISATGVTSEKDVRVLIGKEGDSLNKLNNIPNSLK